tara:strand:- start:721 stop:1065 length:345 start_codon:yes stop_codon:yes gene_type:complete
MNIKRKQKNGYVYLLGCSIDCKAYKYGCTTLTPKVRCKKINSENKQFNFKVIASFKSFDIFKDENNIKWNMLPCGIGSFSEFFYSCGDFTYTRSQLINMFLVTGGVLEKDNEVV